MDHQISHLKKHYGGGGGPARLRFQKEITLLEISDSEKMLNATVQILCIFHLQNIQSIHAPSILIFGGAHINF